MKDLSTDAPGSFQQILQGREMGNRVKANRMCLGLLVGKIGPEKEITYFEIVWCL
jgi:hypothetical protein